MNAKESWIGQKMDLRSKLGTTIAYIDFFWPRPTPSPRSNFKWQSLFNVETCMSAFVSIRCMQLLSKISSKESIRERLCSSTFETLRFRKFLRKVIFDIARKYSIIKAVYLPKESSRLYVGDKVPLAK